VRRAVTTYVDDRAHILSDFACLYASVRALAAEDTDLIVFGPAAALAQLPPDVDTVRCERRAGKWDGYGFVNSIFFLTTEGADVLDGYDLVLRTDADVFLLPAWRDYRPSGFRVGRGLYAHDQHVRDRLAAHAGRLGLRYAGRTDLGSTHCGPPAVVRRVAALAFEIADDLWSGEFHRDPGRWPGWFRGVTTMYANELAVNHLVDEFERDAANLDAASTSRAAPTSAAHVHCWHTDQLFSKFAYRAGAYDKLDPAGLDPAQIRHYCLCLALSARREHHYATRPVPPGRSGY